MKTIFPQENCNRKHIRLKNYDYSQNGSYFITICSYNYKCIFGEITNGKIQLNEFGETIKREWHELKNKYLNIEQNEYVIMPNHFHGVLSIARCNKVNGLDNPAPTAGIKLGQIIADFKYQTTKIINEKRNTGFQKLWQRNYYEHVVRNFSDLNNIREYIANNPIKWQLDKYYR